MLRSAAPLSALLLLSLLVVGGAHLAQPLGHVVLDRAILADLVVTLPLAFWIGGRVGRIRRLPPTVLLGTTLLASLLLLPAPLREDLKSVLAPALPWIEAATLGLLALRLRRFAGQSADLYMASHRAAESWLGEGRLARILGSELAMLAYLVVPRRPAEPGDFNVHATSGFRPILWALMAVGLLELVVVHVLLHLASPMLAWGVTGLSALGMLFLVAHIRALAARPHRIEEGTLLLRNGLFGTAGVPLSGIAEIRRAPTDQQGITRFAALGGMEPMSVLLRLRSPVTIQFTRGLTRQADTLLLPVDDADRFVKAVAEAVAREG